MRMCVHPIFWQMHHFKKARYTTTLTRLSYHSNVCTGTNKANLRLKIACIVREAISRNIWVRLYFCEPFRFRHFSANNYGLLRSSVLAPDDRFHSAPTSRLKFESVWEPE